AGVLGYRSGSRHHSPCRIRRAPGGASLMPISTDMSIDTASLLLALDRAGLLVAADELPSTVSGITDDSRRVAPGMIFIAVRGSVLDGHEFLPVAANAGAALAVVEDEGRTTLPQVVVRDA